MFSPACSDDIKFCFNSSDAVDLTLELDFGSIIYIREDITSWVWNLIGIDECYSERSYHVISLLYMLMCSFSGVLDETVSHENVALRRAEKCIPVVTPYCVLSLHVLFASHIERGVANSSVPSVHLTVSLESGRKHDNFRYWPEISVSQHAFSV